jgi:polysaccharide pyruvyl transferase WcaK-like protein
MLAHAALRLADYRSYRDRKSKDLAAGLPLTHGDPVYPDLAFSYERRAPGNHAGEERRHPVVGISPIAYMSRYGWPDRDSGVYNNYVRSLVDLIAELAGRDCAIVLFSSDAADLPVVGELMERLAERPDGDLSTRVTRRSTLTLDELIPEVDACDYVVASRLHGVILSHLRGRPTLAISYDRKVDTHMRDMGMPEYCLDIHKLESTSLIAAMTTLMANGASVQARLRAAAASRADALQQQYDRVWSAIGAGQRA